MILYFLRHGKAGTSNWAAGLDRDDDDDARQLTTAGEEDLRRAAPLWRQLNCRPEVVISSPLPRALRTAELFCEAVGGAPLVDDRLRPGARWGDLARAMAAHPDARRVMFVGHEPDLSSAIAELSGASSVRMRKGGLACLEFYGVPEPGTGELAWLIDPDLYGVAADG